MCEQAVRERAVRERGEVRVQMMLALAVGTVNNAAKLLIAPQKCAKSIRVWLGQTRMVLQPGQSNLPCRACGRSTGRGRAVQGGVFGFDRF